MINRREVIARIAAGGIGLALGHRALQAQTQSGPGLLIRRGRVVNADGVRQADVRVTGETIEAIAPALQPRPGERIIDATGHLVMPGGVDPHTHIEGYSVDNLRVGSEAALAGGITTVATFAAVEKGETIQIAWDRVSGQVPTDAIADVFFHPMAWPPTDEVIAAMPRFAAEGQPSFKIFLAEDNAGEHLHNVVRAIEAARDAGVVTLVHCEDSSILRAAARQLVATGRTTARDYPASRPVAAEVAATAQMASLCETLGAPMYIVHVSSARALDACVAPRRAGAPLYVETRPLYLHLTEERAQGDDAALFTGFPPLRTQQDRAELWRGLADKRIDVLATDHAPFTRARKLDPAVSLTNPLPGVSDLQFMLPMYFSEGVGKRKIPLPRFVETTSTNAARIFGLYPRKGAIRVGSDADIVIWDPSKRGVVRAEADFSNTDYSVYEGWEVTGWPLTTIRRGEVVYENGRVTGQPGSGRLLKRAPWRR